MAIARALLRSTWSLTLIVAALGCGDDGNTTTVDAGLDAPAGDPIVAPADQWTWVQIPGMHCGNGSDTGVAVNLTGRSRDVVVLLAGGGACWDALTCFQLHTAAGIDTDFGSAQFQQAASEVEASPLFSRAASAPFPDASYVFVPYCTGDVHTGHKVTTYTTNAGPRDVHHVGQENLDALWPRLRATRPDASSVWVTGLSAGGYGAMIEAPRARTAWPTATVHILSDSSHPVDPPAAQWTAMRTAWNLEIPAGCPGCATGLAAYPAYLQSISPAGTRWGLLMTTRDQTIATYMQIPQAQLETRTLAIRDAMVAGTGQAAFVINGTNHVLTASSPLPMTAGGVQLSAWLRDLATGSPNWHTVGP